VKRSELFTRLAERLSVIVAEEYGQKSVCIPASYHALELLRDAGIPARLASMNAIAMNHPFVDWLRERDAGFYNPMPPWAWAVGLTEGNPDADGYLSHLVVRSKSKIIDCAAGQMSRPKRGMSVPNGLVISGGVWQSETTIVTYQSSAEPVPPMWRLDPQATARVRARMKVEVYQ